MLEAANAANIDWFLGRLAVGQLGEEQQRSLHLLPGNIVRLETQTGTKYLVEVIQPTTGECHLIRFTRAGKSYCKALVKLMQVGQPFVYIIGDNGSSSTRIRTIELL